MLINPALWMRSPAPVRRIWRRRVEVADAVAAPERVELGEHRLAEAEAAPETVALDAPETAQPSVYETPMLAPTTLASLNALRAADAEVGARALLAGAKTHGPINLACLKVILQHLDEIGASAEDRLYVLAHFGDPADMPDLLAPVHDLATAQETYHLAALMSDANAPREREWLAALRGQLRERAARFV